MWKRASSGSDYGEGEGGEEEERRPNTKGEGVWEDRQQHSYQGGSPTSWTFLPFWHTPRGRSSVFCSISPSPVQEGGKGEGKEREINSLPPEGNASKVHTYHSKTPG